MKVYYFIYAVLIPILLQSCFQDDSTLPDKVLSEITITSSYDTLSVNLGNEFTHTVKVEQSGEQKPLTYEWGYATYDPKGEAGYPVKDSLKVISDQPEVRYTFKKLGAYYLRLKVDNGESIRFKGFLLNVTSKYDEGLTVLSQDEEGNARVSFLRTLTRQEIESGMTTQFITNVLEVENPDYKIKDVTDIRQYGTYLLMSSGEEGTMYKLNAKTFGVVYKNKVADLYPEFSCIGVLGSPSKTWMLSKDGNAYRYDLNTNIVYQLDNATGYGFDACYDASDSYAYFIDYDKSVAYAPLAKVEPAGTGSYLYGYDIISLVYYSITKVYIVTRSKSEPSKGQIFYFSGTFSYKGILSSFNDADKLKIDRNSLMLTTSYNDVCYNYKNGIYRWKASGALPQTPAITFSDKEEVTTIALSTDKKLIYVGVYDGRLEGRKGCVYVYDADSFNLVQEYKGIADRPIKVFYKKK